MSVDGTDHTSLADGCILKLPAERISGLLAVIDDLLDPLRAPTARHWNRMQGDTRRDVATV
jgi:hypothetical protein